MHHPDEELIQRSIDDDVTDAEKRQLEERLASDPEARQLRTDLEEVAVSLRELEEYEPPAGLRREILDSIPRRQPGVGERLTRALGLGGPAWLPRAALVAGAGIVAALLLFYFVPGDSLPTDGRGLTGTLVPAGSAGEVALDEAWLSGLLRARETATGIALTIDATVDEPVEIRLGFDPSRVQFVASGADTGIELGPGNGQVRLTTLGSRVYELELERVAIGEIVINFEFQGPGSRRHEVTLPLPEP